MENELNELYLYGVKVFDSDENFHNWLKSPNIVLNGETPQKLLETIDGISIVKDVICRIEYGVYS